MSRCGDVGPNRGQGSSTGNVLRGGNGAAKGSTANTSSLMPHGARSSGPGFSPAAGCTGMRFRAWLGESQSGHTGRPTQHRPQAHHWLARSASPGSRRSGARWTPSESDSHVTAAWPPALVIVVISAPDSPRSSSFRNYGSAQAAPSRSTPQSAVEQVAPPTGGLACWHGITRRVRAARRRRRVAAHAALRRLTALTIDCAPGDGPL